MKEIILSNGVKLEVECLSCALTSGLVEPEGGTIVETDYFMHIKTLLTPLEV